VLDLPIIDAHQHFWDPPSTPHPWLSTAPLPDFRYGDYAALRRPYLPADFRADAKGHNIVATVHMEAEWDTSDEVGETRWLATLRAAHGLPTVAIGHARFEDPSVAEVLTGHAGFDFTRGVRQRPTAAPAPSGARRGAAGSMDDPRWRRGYVLLERHGFSYDLQTPWWHLDAAADLAHAFPRTTIIVNHIPGRATPIARWYGTRSRSSARTAACSPATTRSTACASATGPCSTTSNVSWPTGLPPTGWRCSTITRPGSTGGPANPDH
jgi:predicted TIM-barrel fold metal-dependent hydrolase